MRGMGLIAAVALAAGAAQAQDEDAMAVQRCVWSCLANAQGNDAAYRQCVRDFCDGFGDEDAGDDAQGAASGQPRSARWYEGTLAGGATSFAGIDSADGGVGLYYFCDRAGRSDVMLAGIDGPVGYWILSVDVHDLGFAFTPVENGLAAPVPAGHGLFGYLKSGAEVLISQADGGGELIRLPLAGSSRALGRAMARCG